MTDDYGDSSRDPPNLRNSYFRVPIQLRLTTQKKSSAVQTYCCSSCSNVCVRHICTAPQTNHSLPFTNLTHVGDHSPHTPISRECNYVLSLRFYAYAKTQAAFYRSHLLIDNATNRDSVTFKKDHYETDTEQNQAKSMGREAKSRATRRKEKPNEERNSYTNQLA